MKTKKEFIAYCEKLGIPKSDIDYSGKDKTFFIYGKHPSAFALLLVTTITEFKIKLIDSQFN